MTKTAIQTVLDALTTVDSCVGLKNYFHDKPDGTDVRLDQVVDDAIAILQAALAEPSEPVAWLGDGGSLWLRNTSPYSNGRGQPLFTHPASKPEPLTDEEILLAISPFYKDTLTRRAAIEVSIDEYRAVEAAVWEKMNGE